MNAKLCCGFIYNSLLIYDITQFVTLSYGQSNNMENNIAKSPRRAKSNNFHTAVQAVIKVYALKGSVLPNV